MAVEPAAGAAAALAAELAAVGVADAVGAEPADGAETAALMIEDAGLA